MNLEEITSEKMTKILMEINMNDPKKALRLICVRLPRGLHLSAKKRALEEGKTLQELIAEVLDGYLKICEEIDETF